MTWNWQKKNWPQFIYNQEAIRLLEQSFLQKSGEFSGLIKFIDEKEKKKLLVNLITTEAITTSEIEGEYLVRDSVQSSIKKHFGILQKEKNFLKKETGVSQLILDSYETYSDQLSHNYLFNWHKLLMQGYSNGADIGKYRTHLESMLVVSGKIDKPNIHFQAPPSGEVFEEMAGFIEWFNETNGKLGNLLRSAITHLYFVSIHPFEDGNGRIARTLSEKALSQGVYHPTLTSLSTIMSKNKKLYYQKLAENNQNLDITDWIVYFAETVLKAQEYTQKMIELVIQKTKTFDKYKNSLNERQVKVLNKLFDVGPEGFAGGLSNSNYIAIATTSIATATRDLNDLVEKEILTKTGDKRYARYYLVKNYD